MTLKPITFKPIIFKIDKIIEIDEIAEIERINRIYYSNNIINNSPDINNEMQDILIYGNAYVKNDLILNYNYFDYLKIGVEIHEKGVSHIPYNQIIVKNGIVKKLTGTIYPTYKLFQFKCRLYNISIDEINKILKRMNEKDFYYTNWKYADYPRDMELDLFSTKEEKIINNILLLSVGEIPLKKYY